MQDKYKVLLNQLIQWYHMESKELDDLEWYLTSHLNTIKIRKWQLSNEQSFPKATLN